MLTAIQYLKYCAQYITITLRFYFTEAERTFKNTFTTKAR